MTWPPEKWSDEAKAMLAVGEERLTVANAAAHRHVLLATYCNGKAECTSETHLACCLALRATD